MSTPIPILLLQMKGRGKLFRALFGGKEDDQPTDITKEPPNPVLAAQKLWMWFDRQKRVK